MAITTHDLWVAAPKVPYIWFKTGTRTLVAGIPFSVFDLAGLPGAGTLAIGNTANGVVPTDAVTGYPAISTFGALLGYLSSVDLTSSVLCKWLFFDRIFAAGAYTFNADVTLASQPSYVGRMPASSYAGTQLWLETVTAFTGSQSIQINYLDQDGNAGDTGVVATGVAPTVGRCFIVPLAAGDNGVSQITRVRSSISTAGTFNVMVLRPLFRGRVQAANAMDSRDYIKLGLPQMFADMAIYGITQADSTAVGLPVVDFQLALG
jgi:hypothetical protein